MMRKTFTAACLFFLVCLVLFSDVHAMDPVTIAILAPIAAKAAEVATPYVIRGLQCGGLHMVKMGTRLIDLFRLPLGLLQATVGIPFNLFSQFHHGSSRSGQSSGRYFASASGVLRPYRQSRLNLLI